MRLTRILALAWVAGPIQAAPTFYRDVLPILQDHCQVCHRAGQIGPMPLGTYADAKKWAGEIARRTTAREMPPWFADGPGEGSGEGHRFSNDPSLTTAQIRTLSEWAAAGAPGGNPSDARKPRDWTPGFGIPRPDLVVTMPKPVAIPATGTIDYTYEIVHTGFTEDRWVRMSEIRPGSRAHVHHAVVYVRPPDSGWLRDKPVGVAFTAPDDMTTSDLLLVYAPGSSPDEWPESMAKLIPKGSDLVFQMHYTSNGHAAVDRTAIGLVFSKARPEKRVLTLQLTNSHFHIPPNDPAYRAEARGTIPNDALLLSFFPHLHLRGKEFEYNILTPRPGGGVSVQQLLHVNYNFYWQLSYKLARPLPIAAGTELQAVAIWDNSRGNRHNPDPSAEVSWGDQTTDEMLVGFFDVAVPADTDKFQFFMREH